MSVDFEWEAHTPVELRRHRGLPGGNWKERQHPRDGEGKFTRGQRVKVPVGKRNFKGTVASKADAEGNYTVRVDNGVNGRRAKYHHSQITPTETRGAARARNAGAAAAVPLLIGAHYWADTGRNPITDVGAAGRNMVAKAKQNKNDRQFKGIMKNAGWKGNIGPARRSRI